MKTLCGIPAVPSSDIEGAWLWFQEGIIGVKEIFHGTV